MWEIKQVVESPTAKVTGIGGIFFRSKDPKAAKEWYGKNLGLAISEYGSSFEFRNANRPDEIHYLQWSPFDEGNKIELWEPVDSVFTVMGGATTK